jgi:hypothetical protein
LSFLSIDIPNTKRSEYIKSVSKKVDVGIIDTLTRQAKFYETIFANIKVSQQYFIARGEMFVNIKDAAIGNIISNTVCRVEYPWDYTYADLTGDIEALDSKDWDLVNKNSIIKDAPNKEEVLAELYNKVYPEIKNSIINSVRW